MNLFSIIVPTFGRPATTLTRLFDSLSALPARERRLIGEIVLADQNGTPLDFTAWLAGKSGQGFRWQVSRNGRSVRRRGTGPIALVHLAGLRPSVTAAKNAAVGRSRQAWLLFLDDDVEVLPGALFAHARWLAACPGLGCLGGRETVVPAALGQSRPVGMLAGWISRRLARRTSEADYMWHGRHVGRLTHNAFFLCDFDLDVDGLVRADIVRGCHCSLPRAAFDTVGGFDEGFAGTALREETDLHLRLLDAGYRNAFTGQARVLHHRGGGGCGNLSQAVGALRSKLLNETRFQLKHFAGRPAFWFGLRLLPLVARSIRPTHGRALFLWLLTLARFVRLKHARRARERWLARPSGTGC